MIMNIIMMVCLYPTMILVFFLLRHSLKGNDAYHYGVRMEKEWLASDVYLEVETRYRKQMNGILAAALITPFFCFMTDSVSIQYTIWMVWFLFFIFAMEVPYVLAFNRLKAYKKEMLGLASQEKLVEQYETTYVDLEVAGSARKGILRLFLPQLLLVLAAACAIYLLPVKGETGSSYFLTVNRGVILMMAAVTLLIAGIAAWVEKGPLTVISEDSRINANYNRAKRSSWRNCWQQMGWINTVLVVLLSVSFLLGWNMIKVLLWGSVAECFLIFFPIAAAIRRNNALQKTYVPKKEKKFSKDDEDSWIWGLIYYNPYDNRTLVEQRVALGMTFNMAKPLGIAVDVFATACLVIAIPFSSIWMILEERSPKLVYLENEHIICEDRKVEYDIPLEDIDSAEWAVLPEERTKTNGSNWPNFEKGRYYEYWEKDFYEFCFTNQEEMIRLQVGEDKYYISCCDAGDTQKLMQEILAAME